MTRGRKKDLTILPSRALAQQRDYRARKARYVQQLEDRCKAAEDETRRLKMELDLVRAGVPSMFSPQAVEASSELLKQLSAASACLSQFQQFAFRDTTQTRPPIPPSAQFHALRPASFPSPVSSPPAFYPTPSASGSSNRDLTHNDTGSHSQSSADSNDRSAPPGPPFSRETMTRSPSLGSECCGGFMDCTHLVEEEQDELQEDDLGPSSMSLMRTSEMRSTSDEIPSTDTGQHVRSS